MCCQYIQVHLCVWQLFGKRYTIFSYFEWRKKISLPEIVNNFPDIARTLNTCLTIHQGFLHNTKHLKHFLNYLTHRNVSVCFHSIWKSVIQYCIQITFFVLNCNKSVM